MITYYIHNPPDLLHAGGVAIYTRNTAYRHPSFNPVRFKEQLESTLSQLTRENKTIFIMGDFNVNLLNCESS